VIQFSLWDRHAYRCGTAPTLVDALLARTEGFDAVHQLDATARDRLALEYWRRVSYWNEDARAAGRWNWIVLAISGFLAVLATLALALAGLVLGLGVMLIAAAGVASAHYGLGQHQRLARALKQGLCPDCSYNLRGTEPAVDPRLVDGQFVGPQRCPECGSRWPLLPGPVPGAGRLVGSGGSG
jgi:hypothetical protein